jgi:hypothetical protein
VFFLSAILWFLCHDYKLDGQPNGWCEPRPPAAAGKTHLNHQYLCRQDWLQ